MRFPTVLILLFMGLTSLTSSRAIAGCDQSLGNILSKHLRPVIENMDCAPLKQRDLTDRSHTLAGVCYQFFGQISRITLDAHLSCHASSENVVSKLFGPENAPGIAENVTVDVEVGEDCHPYDVKVQSSGDLGRLFAELFGEDGAARKALEEGLAEVCKK